MTSIIKLSCLSGGQDCSPPCYLLQIDQFRCLLDCGWDEKIPQFKDKDSNDIKDKDIKINIDDIKNKDSRSNLEDIAKHFKTLDAILLSYPDPAHLGALPYLIKEFGLPCPIYATRPVTLMGQMFMTDLLLSRLNDQEFDLFSLEDIKAAFENDKIVHLDFNQTYYLEGQGCGLSIEPLAAGHMIGGTIWKIVKDNEEVIVYAIDYNHKKDKHLDGCSFDKITKPSLLITDAYNAENIQGRMKARDEKFFDTIRETLRRGGNVLIACDTAGRVLELVYMLDHMWRKKETGLSAYSLALASNVSIKMIDITMSLIEWMSEKFQRDFREGSRDNPFKFEHLKLKQHYSELCFPEPMTVLATQPDLESGAARNLFLIWCTKPKNSIIFTQRCNPNTLGAQVYDDPTSKLTVEVWQRIALEGEELEEFKRKEEEKKHLALIESQKAMAINDSDSEDDSTKEKPNKSKGLNAVQIPSKHDLMMTDGHTKATVFFKQARKTYPMFPAPADRKIIVDDYGEHINPDDYILTHKLQNNNKVLEVEDTRVLKVIENISDKEIEPEVKPTKCIKIDLPLQIEAQIHRFDYEGRSDGESVRNLVSQVKPRRLILVRGDKKSTKYMRRYCEAHVKSDRIFTPETGDIVDASTENYIYQVKLKDSLVSSLDFQTAENGVEFAWVDAQTQLPEQDEINNEELPHLDAVEAEDVPLHNAIFINEIRLPDFKQVLLNNGIQAEISDGVLYCNDKVTVRRRKPVCEEDNDAIHLEGVLCDDYFKVRDLLYKQYLMI